MLIECTAGYLLQRTNSALSRFSSGYTNDKKPGWSELTCANKEQPVSIEDAPNPVPSAVAAFYMPPCPRCGEQVLAPHIVTFRADDAIRHHWSCDDCGYEFETRIKLP